MRCHFQSRRSSAGFRLKAKFIIHAVGPRYCDGQHDEPKQLYGAYRRSLELAVENDCESIGFPLISAGIFGYPAKQAWQVAIQACRDFTEEGNTINIVFAVLDDAMLRQGQEILGEEPA